MADAAPKAHKGLVKNAGAAVLARALWPFAREVALHVQASRAISIAGLPYTECI